MAYPFDKIKLPHLKLGVGNGVLFCNKDGSFKIVKGQNDPIFRIIDPVLAKKITQFLYDVYLCPHPMLIEEGCYPDHPKDGVHKEEPDKVDMGQEINLDVFEKDLADLINRHDLEGLANVPDYILAKHLRGCLNSFCVNLKENTRWHSFNDKSRCDSKTQKNGTQT